MYIPVFFGHEGVEKEFKTSAFIHADKNATEEQSLVLARVIASFMNTEGGTLYIGVNDKGYLTGLDQELRFAHNDSDVYLRSVNQNVIRLLGKKKIGIVIRRIYVAVCMNMKTDVWFWRFE